MTCQACGQPLENGRHPNARQCLRPECISVREKALRENRRKQVAA